MNAALRSNGNWLSGFRLLEGARKISNRWEGQLQSGDPRRWQVGEIRRLIEGRILAADDSPRSLASAHHLLCVGCASVHPGLASLCCGRSVTDLQDCWLLKGYRCPVVPLRASLEVA